MRLRARTVPALLVLAYVFARNAGGPFPHLAFYLLVVTVVLAAAWVLAGRRSVEVNWSPPASAARLGDTLTVRVQVFNDGLLPAPPLDVALLGVDGEAGRPVRLVLGPYGGAHLAFEVPLTRRGDVTIGPVRAELADPAGIFAAAVPSTGPAVIRVYPRLLEPGTLSLSGLGGLGDEAARRLRRSEMTPESELVGVRPWRPGDSTRLIDWKATARRGDLHVKEFTPPSGRRVLVALDLYGPAQWGAGPEGSEERLVSLAATLCRDLLRAGIAAGLVAGGEPPLTIPPATGPRQWPALIEALTDARAGTLSLARALGAVLNLPSFRAHALVALTPRPERALGTVLSRWARAGADVTMAWLPRPEDHEGDAGALVGGPAWAGVSVAVVHWPETASGAGEGMPA